MHRTEGALVGGCSSGSPAHDAPANAPPVLEEHGPGLQWTSTPSVRHAVRKVCEEGLSRDALEGGEVSPPPPPGRCPATVPLTASASFNGIRNRQ